MGETCELLIATNLPVLRSWQLSLNPAWAERYAVLEVEVPDRGTLFVAAGPHGETLDVGDRGGGACA
jgi:hypothetical protein